MKKKRDGRILPWLMLAVSFAGFCIFYLAPFAVSFLYSLTDDPIHRAFAGAANYIGLFRNVYFVRGLKNTLCFIAVCIPLHMALSLAAALIVHGWKRGSEWIGLIFLLPLAIPSAASAFFWQKFFGQEGALNHILTLFRAEGPDWLNSKYGMPVMAVIFRKIIKEKYVVTKTETQNSLTEYGFLSIYQTSGFDRIYWSFYARKSPRRQGRFFAVAGLPVIYLSATVCQRRRKGVCCRQMEL